MGTTGAKTNGAGSFLEPLEDDEFWLRPNSDLRRGRVVMNLPVAPNAHLQLAEWVSVWGRRVRRLEYAYRLIVDGRQLYGWDYDPVHGYHEHPDPDDRERRQPAERVTAEQVVARSSEILGIDEALADAA